VADFIGGQADARGPLAGRPIGGADKREMADFIGG